MPVGDILARGLHRLTPQQIADLALSEDREARRARAAGRHDDAATHERERDLVLSALN